MEVPGLATVRHHVLRAGTIAPGPPALWLGLRVAAATALPMLLWSVLGPVAGTWAPLAGFGIALVDKGGAYRTRARTMAGTTAGALLAIVYGSLLPDSGWAQILGVTLGISLCALTHAWGPPGPSMGNTIAVQLMVAAFIPNAPGDVGLRVAGYALGALGAMFLGLVVWPVRVYKPGRRAVAQVLAALSAHAELLSRFNRREPGWREDLVGRHRTIREDIEKARSTLAATRRGRRGESGRGERLLVVLEACEQLFGVQVSLEEVLEAGCPPATSRWLMQELQRLASALAELAERVQVETQLAPVQTPRWDLAAAREVVGAEKGPERFLSEHALMLVTRLDENLRRASEFIDSLYSDTRRLPDGLLDHAPRPATAISRLRAILSRDSMVLRHVFRVAVAVFCGTLLTNLLALKYGYWVMMTCFLLLQPFRVKTTTMTLQRTAGTILGALLAAGLAWAVRDDPMILMATVVLLAGVSASVLQLNYALFSIFVTPTFVLLLEIHAGADPSLFWTRALNTLLGGLLALGAVLLLWPERERVQFADQMGRALEAAGRYLEEVEAAVAANRKLPVPEIQAARRRFGLALNNAEVVLERVIAEQAPASVLEPRMTLVTFTRRLGTAINVFGSTRAVVAYGPHNEAIAAYARSAQERLGLLAQAVRTGTAPGALPAPRLEIDDPVIASRLGRIEAQLTVLGETVRRTAR